MKIGVIDVGGGMRGNYATGVLDYCLDANIHFDYCIGVSAGSANLASYLGNQKGRNKHFYEEYMLEKECMSISNFIKKGSYIDMDILYGKLSNSDGRNPLNYQALMENPAQFITVAQNAITGETVYFTKDNLHQDDYRIFMASSSIPAINKPYDIDGTPYFDGALGDPLPIQKALRDGCDKVVIILTKPSDKDREPGEDPYLAAIIKHKYPNSAKNLRIRSIKYNYSMYLAKKLERKDKVLIIAPSTTEGVSTLTKDTKALKQFYKMGYNDGKKIKQWLNK